MYSLQSIRIKRINTGETIILVGGNATVIYDALIGTTTGSFTAGVFNYDCNGDVNPKFVSINRPPGFPYSFLLIN